MIRLSKHIVRCKWLRHEQGNALKKRFKFGLDIQTISKSKVSNFNLLPTLLDILGISYEKANIHGSSMRRLLSGDEEDSNIFTLTGITGKAALIYEEGPYVLLSVIRKSLKLILIIRHDNSRTYELYDLEKDPRERNNLIASSRYKTKIDLLKAMMRDWTQKVDLKLDLYKIEDTASELSPEILEQLKSLGYLN